MPPRILVARQLPEAAMRVLNGCAEVDVHRQETPLTKAELIERLSDKQALVCQLTQTVDAEVLTAGKKLRVVANVAVGFDNIDVAAATERGIAVTNTPGVLDETTADFAWTLLLIGERKRGFADRGRLVLLVWTAALFLLVLAQRRFMESLAPAMAILMAAALIRGYRAVYRLRGKNASTRKQSQVSRPFPL